MTTGERMRNRRKELGISAETVAEHLGVSPATIYRYENGDIDKVPGDRLGPIAEALYTTPAYLMGWDEKKPVEPDRPKKKLRSIARLEAEDLSEEADEQLRRFIDVYLKTNPHKDKKGDISN